MCLITGNTSVSAYYRIVTLCWCHKRTLLNEKKYRACWRSLKHVGNSIWHVQNEKKQKHDYLHHRKVEYGTTGSVINVTRRGFFFFLLAVQVSAKQYIATSFFTFFTNEYTCTHKVTQTKEGNWRTNEFHFRFRTAQVQSQLLFPRSKGGKDTLWHDNEENGSRLGNKFSLLIFAVGLTCRVKPIHTKKQGRAQCIVAVCTLHRRIRSTSGRGGKWKQPTLHGCHHF